jgi:uncharacterized protein
MIIDCHTHLGRNEHINVSVKELLDSMDEADVDKALVFAGELNNCPNEWMLEQIAPHKDRLLGVAAVNGLSKYSELQNVDIKRLLDSYGNGNIVAVKFYTGYDHYIPSDAERYLSHLQDVGCPVIFHMGDCLNSVKKAKLKYANPLLIDDVAVDFPNMNFIIAHMGYPFQREAAEVCYKNSNVYADISGFVYGEFKHSDEIRFKKTVMEFLDISTSDKLLFGTDFPISDQKSYLNSLDNCFGEMLTAQTLSQNIEKVFKL